MVEPTEQSTELEAVAPAPKSFRKGALIRVKLDSYVDSVESKASDPVPPDYILQGPGEVLIVKGEYAQIRWRQPVPDVWLKLDQLEAWKQ